MKSDAQSEEKRQCRTGSRERQGYLPGAEHQSRQAPPGSRPSKFNCRQCFAQLPPSAFRLPTSDFRLPTSAFRLPTSHFPLPTSHFPLYLSPMSQPTPSHCPRTIILRPWPKVIFFYPAMMASFIAGGWQLLEGNGVESEQAGLVFFTVLALNL